MARIGVQVVNPSLFNPCTWTDLASDLAVRSAAGCRAALRGDAELGALELVNKSQIFVLVLSVGRLIGVPSAGFPLPLEELVRRSYALGDFRALWAIEGLGHDYGESFYRQGRAPRGILFPSVVRGLPSSALLMLNAGIGLAFADQGLEDLPAIRQPDRLARTVETILRLTPANATPGSEGASFESLGLVTRLFFPRLTHDIDRILRHNRPELRGFFWHGAGRALYFTPVSFLPFSIWQAYEMAEAEAPDELALHNARAGITWAFLLVNQRQPEIMADLLIRPYGERILRMRGFRNGIASATIMRYDTTPGAPFIRSFCDYRPEDPRTGQLWTELVRRPCHRALEVIYPRLLATNRLGQVFRFHDGPRWWEQAA